jgi:hypothetical protein
MHGRRSLAFGMWRWPLTERMPDLLLVTEGVDNSTDSPTVLLFHGSKAVRTGSHRLRADASGIVDDEQPRSLARSVHSSAGGSSLAESGLERRLQHRQERPAVGEELLGTEQHSWFGYVRPPSSR